MATLRGLPGIKKKEIDCEFIRKVTDIKTILNKGAGATAAGDRGAINIWKDDAGLIRCVAQRYMSTIDSREYELMDDVEKWAKKYLKIIK